MNDSERIERGIRVRRLLESAEWVDAWDAVRATYLHVIEEGTDEQALEARRMLRAAIAARSHLTAFITDGTLMEADMAARRSRMHL